MGLIVKLHDEGRYLVQTYWPQASALIWVNGRGRGVPTSLTELESVKSSLTRNWTSGY